MPEIAEKTNTALSTAIDAVLTLETFAPSPAVNAVMHRLVDSVVIAAPEEYDTLDFETVQRVRAISAHTESKLEQFWTQKILAADDHKAALTAFPYLGNYTELVRRELALLQETGFTLTSGKTALIIGSGPLPLTAYELELQTGATVDHIDASAEAAKLCEQLCRAIGAQGRVHYGAGETIYLHKQYDFILIAALAGETLAQKQAIVDNVRTNLAPGGRVIIRSAHGARRVLYPAIEAAAIANLALLNEYHPTDEIINSVLIYGAKV